MVMTLTISKTMRIIVDDVDMLVPKWIQSNGLQSETFAFERYGKIPEEP